MQRRPYKIPRQKAEQIIREAMILAGEKNVLCDELNCAKSWSRQSTDKTPEEVLQMSLKGKNTIWTFIFHDTLRGQEPYFDIGCIARENLGGTEYFLWIKLDVEAGDKLIQKYSL